MRWTRRDAGHKPSAAPIIEDVPFFTKGQRPESHLPGHIAGNSIEQLQKAERVLGISQRHSSLVTPINARQRATQPVVSAQESAGGDQWGTHSQQEYQPMDNARSANGGLKPWPSLQSTNNHASTHDMRVGNGGRALPAHLTSSTTAHHHQDPRELSNSTLHLHHEASQQSPPSAARDMSLRKAPSEASSNRNAVGQARTQEGRMEIRQHLSQAPPLQSKSSSAFAALPEWLFTLGRLYSTIIRQGAVLRPEQ
jgi:hypothetical protein